MRNKKKRRQRRKLYIGDDNLPKLPSSNATGLDCFPRKPIEKNNYYFEKRFNAGRQLIPAQLKRLLGVFLLRRSEETNDWDRQSCWLLQVRVRAASGQQTGLVGRC